MDVGSAVVINLPRRRDRLAEFRARWDPSEPPLSIVTMAAVDGALLRCAPARRHLAGAVGCYLSHRAILTHAERAPLLVLEDDAIPTPDFWARVDHLTPPAGWDLIYLGGQHLKPPEPVAPGLARCVSTLRTHAYIAARPQELARLLDNSGGCHVDEHLDRLPLDRYAVTPWAAAQAAGWSDVMGARIDHDRTWER